MNAGGHAVSVRSRCVVVDGEVRAVSPAGMALIKTLASRPGRVVSREDLLGALPGGGDDTHAVETAMTRLRSSLGAPKVVQTVVKRGYRLAVEPTDVAEECDEADAGATVSEPVVRDCEGSKY